MRRKLKFKVLLLLMLICLSVGFFTAYKIFQKPKRSAETWIVPDASNPGKRFITEETLINHIKQKQELIPLEVELTEVITIDDSWGNLELFRKFQTIHFVGKGLYAIDLSMIYSERLELDHDKRVLTITLPSPIIKAIALDEQKTLYETPAKGVLRFGDIKMTAAEYQFMITQAKRGMLEKMALPDLYGQAKKSAEIGITGLLTSIMDSETKARYSIVVRFE